MNRASLSFPLLLSAIGIWWAAALWTVMTPGLSYSPEAGVTITNGLDFLNYWGGTRIASYDLMALFDEQRYLRAMHGLYEGTFGILNWSYPLPMLFFCAPFASLAYVPALMAWSVTGLGIYLLACRAALPATSRNVVTLLLILAPATILNLLMRQNGFFTAAGAIFVLVLLQRNRPVAAGLLLGCLSVKPQLFVLWPFMLLLQGNWRCIIAATLSVVALYSLSYVVHGAAAWQTYIDTVPALQWNQLSLEMFEAKRLLSHLMMPGFTPALRLLHVGDPLAQLLQLAVSAGVAIMALAALRKPLPLSLRMLLLASAGMLVSPYGFNYDLTFLSAALLLRWIDRPAGNFAAILVEGLAYLLPFAVYFFNLAEVPLGPLVLALVFLRGLREARTITNASAA